MTVLRIAMAAHKGGSGKTTVTANLAGALVASGRSVLVVDVDPQGACGSALGVSAAKPTIYEVLAGTASIDDAVRPTGIPGLSVLPADLDLAGAEIELPRRASWQEILRDHLRAVRGFDIVLVDTAPGLGVLPFVALVSSERVLVVCPPDFLSLRSLPTVLEAAERADVHLVGIVPNRLEGRTRHEADALAELERAHARLLLPPIPGRVVLRDAAVAGLPVSVYAPGSDAASAFDRLALEVLR